MFKYDPAKSDANLAKHGIDFEAAQALWDDDKRIVLPSSKSEEARVLVVGMIEDRGWTAIVTMRGDVTRLISVRRARKEEMRLYGH